MVSLRIIKHGKETVEHNKIASGRLTIELPIGLDKVVRNANSLLRQLPGTTGLYSLKATAEVLPCAT